MSAPPFFRALENNSVPEIRKHPKRNEKTLELQKTRDKENIK